MGEEIGDWDDKGADSSGDLGMTGGAVGSRFLGDLGMTGGAVLEEAPVAAGAFFHHGGVPEFGA